MHDNVPPPAHTQHTPAAESSNTNTNTTPATTAEPTAPHAAFFWAMPRRVLATACRRGLLSRPSALKLGQRSRPERGPPHAPQKKSESERKRKTKNARPHPDGRQWGGIRTKRPGGHLLCSRPYMALSSCDSWPSSLSRVDQRPHGAVPCAAEAEVVRGWHCAVA